MKMTFAAFEGLAATALGQNGWLAALALQAGLAAGLAATALQAGLLAALLVLLVVTAAVICTGRQVVGYVV